MARMKPDVLESFLQRPIIAVLSTLRRDGRPYQAPVWFLWSDSVFWLTGTYPRLWCRHIFHDARVSLCIEATDPVAQYVAIDCVAEPVEPDAADIWPISRRLVEKYLAGRGANIEAFLEHMREEQRLLFRLVPERWRAIDLQVYVGARGDAKAQRRQ